MITPANTDPLRDFDDPHALAEEQKAFFIEHGYLILRDCFPSETAKELVRRTVVDKDPPPSYRDEFAQHAADVGELDLQKPETWTIPRVYIDTGRSIPIEEFSPKLWGALKSLLGGEEKIGRRTMGEQLIFNADFTPGPVPEMTEEYYGSKKWHIDEPGQYMTLQDRRDAVALLILWSDVGPGGGGPLYTGQSLAKVVEQLEDSELGVDSRGDEWGSNIARQCNDIAEFTGNAGDVLVTHAFALHSPELNYAYKIRVLENPMIRTREPLDYRPDNPAPSPVEASVISKFRRSATEPRRSGRSFRECAQALIDHHPDYFLPNRDQWKSRVESSVQSKVHDLDCALTGSWVSRLADQIKERRDESIDRIRSCIAVVNELFVNQLDFHAHLTEQVQDADFSSTNWSRLFRGFVNCEGQNYTLAVLLDQIFPQVEIFNTVEPRTRQGDHLLVRVETGRGWCFADAWSPNRLYYVDTLKGKPLAGVPEYSTLELQGDRPDIGVVAREAFEGGAVLNVRYPEPAREEFADLAAALRERTDPYQMSPAWTAFLGARLNHVMGDRIGTQHGYQRLIREHRIGGVTASVCKLLAERTADGTILARI